MNIAVKLGFDVLVIGLHFFLYEHRFFDSENTWMHWVFTLIVLDTACGSCGPRIWFIIPAKE